MDREKFKKQCFMEIAEVVSKLSTAEKLKVGAVILDSKNRIVSTGYNGTPKGVDNKCEDESFKTYDYVLHAEENALLNSTKSDLEDCVMYITHSPCIKCASKIAQKGIKKVFFKSNYRLNDGVEFLMKNGIDVKIIDK